MNSNCAATFLGGVLFFMSFMNFSIVCTSVLPLIPCLTWCDTSARQTRGCWTSAPYLVLPPTGCWTSAPSGEGSEGGAGHQHNSPHEPSAHCSLPRCWISASLLPRGPRCSPGAGRQHSAALRGGYAVTLHAPRWISAQELDISSGMAGAVPQHRGPLNFSAGVLDISTTPGGCWISAQPPPRCWTSAHGGGSPSWV